MWSLINPLKPSGYYRYHQVLTFETNSTFRQQSVFVCFAWISEPTTNISLYSIKLLFFYNQDRMCLLRGTK
jgi:hypothetical protein